MTPWFIVPPLHILAIFWPGEDFNLYLPQRRPIFGGQNHFAMN